jgi:hypothetical protein
VKAEAIRNSDEPTVAVLDVDQAELALNPTRTRVWAPVGAPWEVETPGNNRKQGMFGAVNSRGGQTHFQVSAHQRSRDFQQFVDRQIVPAYPQADFIFLIVDGASIYTSKSRRAWLTARPQIVLVPLLHESHWSGGAGADARMHCTAESPSPMIYVMDLRAGPCNTSRWMRRQVAVSS